MSDAQVRWESQQRVDAPDLSAMVELAAQARRRGHRDLFAGGLDTPLVMRGFRVQAEDPGVSPRVLIVQSEGGVQGAFVSALTDGVVFDFGTVGGTGAAQRLLDFTGQPAATYKVKVRDRLIATQSDNRAFWNPSSNMEFVKVTNTRNNPEWEVALSGHGDADWVLLAEVVWGGATVDTVDIADKRNLAFEGSEPYKSTDPSAAFGVGDFNRNSLRGAAVTTLGGVVPAIRALMRQIQDIKGPDEDGNYTAYSRPPGPLMFADLAPSVHNHSNMQTLQSVTYTCAEGDGLYGDFSGVSAVNDCLKFIQDNAANIPAVITVVVKAGRGVTFLLTDNINIPDKLVRIIGVTGASNLAVANDELENGQHQVAIVSNVAAATIALRVNGLGSLYLENVSLAAGVDGINLVRTDMEGSFRSKNVSLLGFNGYALRTGHHKVAMEDTYVDGAPVWIGGRSSWTGTGFTRDRIDRAQSGGYLRNCRFHSNVKLRYKGSPDELWEFANGLLIENCEFRFGSLLTLGVPNNNGQIDARGAKKIKFSGCTITYSGESDALRFGTMEPIVDTFAASEKCLVDHCDFTLLFPATHDGQASGDAGISGTLGTGWGVKIDPGQTVTEGSGVPEHITINGCKFRVVRASSFVDSSPDAGAILSHNGRDIRMEGNSITQWTEPAVLETRLDEPGLITVSATAEGRANGACRVWLYKNFVGLWQENSDPGNTEDYGSWGGTAITHSGIHCVVLDSVAECYLSDNVYSGQDADGTFIVPSATTLTAAQYLGCEQIYVDGDKYVDWLDSVVPSSVGRLSVGVSATVAFSRSISLVNTQFVSCAGTRVLASGALVVEFTIRGCSFLDRAGGPTVTGGKAIDFAFATSVNFLWIEGNKWAYAGGLTDAVRIGGPTFFSFQGNHFSNGRVIHTAHPGPYVGGLGYDIADHNIVGAYA